MINFLIILLSSLFFVSPGENDVLTRLQAEYNSITDFTAVFSQSAESAAGKTISLLKGDFYYKKENKFRIETPGQLIISNGETVWNYNEKLNRAIINNMDEMNFPLIDDILFELPEKGRVEEKKIKNGWQVKIIPDDNSSFRSVSVNVDKNFQITDIGLEGFDDTIYRFSLSEQKYNTGLKDDLFNFSPAEGIEIIDFR